MLNVEVSEAYTGAELTKSLRSPLHQFPTETFSHNKSSEHITLPMNCEKFM